MLQIVETTNSFSLIVKEFWPTIYIPDTLGENTGGGSKKFAKPKFNANISFEILGNK